MEGTTGVINMVPGVGSASSFIIGMGSTLLPLLMSTQEYLPALFKVSYITGFPSNKTPYNLQQIIGKKVACDILIQISNAILTQGMIGQSISLDGMSQSTHTVPFIYQKQIELYRKQIEEEVSQARMIWGGLRMSVA
jgi:hypothetical protein